MRSAQHLRPMVREGNLEAKIEKPQLLSVCSFQQNAENAAEKSILAQLARPDDGRNHIMEIPNDMVKKLHVLPKPFFK